MKTLEFRGRLWKLAGLCALVVSGAATVQVAGSGGRVSAALAAKAVAAVDADATRLETIFKDIHQNPELGFMEARTAGIVAKELRALLVNPDGAAAP